MAEGATGTFGARVGSSVAVAVGSAVGVGVGVSVAVAVGSAVGVREGSSVGVAAGLLGVFSVLPAMGLDSFGVAHATAVAKRTSTTRMIFEHVLPIA
jgi:hypothetical protein